MRLFLRILIISALLVMIFGSINFQFPQIKQVKAQDYSLLTYGGINTAGIQIKGVSNDTTSTTMRFKKQGSSLWKDALPPVIKEANSYAEDYHYEWHDPGCEVSGGFDPDYCQYLFPVNRAKGTMIKRVYGSIFYLEPSTTYTIEVDLKNSTGSVIETIPLTVQTKPDSVKYGTGSTLKVAKSGEDFSSIGAALQAANAGSIIEVQPGSYYESLSVSKSGTADQPITIRGLSGAILDTTGSTGTPFSFADNIHDLVIEGFEIKGMHSGRGAHMKFRSNPTRIVIQNNFFNIPSAYANQYASVMSFTGGGTDVTIQGNTIKAADLGCSVYGGVTIVVNGGKGFIVRNNDIRTEGVQDVVSFDAGRIDETDFNNNFVEVSHCTAASGNFEVDSGLHINMRVWENTIGIEGAKSTVSTAIPFLGPVYFIRNTFYGSEQGDKFDYDGTGKAIKLDQLVDLGPVFFYNNTFHFAGSKWSSDYRFFRLSMLSHSNTVLKNNIVYGRMIQKDAMNNAYIDRSSGYWGQIESDYNLWWWSSVWGDDSWKASPGHNPNIKHPGIDTHSIFAEAKFISSFEATKGDLHLKSDSPAINAGVKLPNINDNANGAPDIGRYEYGQGNGITLIKSVNKTTAQNGDIITFSISYQNGGTAVTSAKIEDTVPTGTTFVIGSITGTGGSYDSVNNKIIWTLGSLAASATGSVSFQVKIN